jgi:sigma-B regulation protein RsbU (phosphoserine phosphatase)
MSSLQAALRVAAPLESDLCSLIRHLNLLLHGMTSGRKYVTLFLAIYDPASGGLQYVNAGHQPPILVSQDSMDQLDATGPPIGLLADMNWRMQTAVMPRSSRLLMYTDGLTEAMNAEEAEYGIPRLKERMLHGLGSDADTLIRGILDSVSEFEAGHPALDDKTLVLLQRA